MDAAKRLVLKLTSPVTDPTISLGSIPNVDIGGASGAHLERVRVALLADAPPNLDHEIQVLLRRRLLIATVLVSTASVVVVLVQWIFGVLLSSIAVGLVVIAVTSGLACLLWRRPTLALRKLRTIELIFVGLIAGYHLFFQTRLPDWALLQGLSRGYRAYIPSLQTDAVILRWFALIVGYGIFIPNTLRRCAVVVSALVLTPIVFNACYALVDLEPHIYWDQLAAQWGFWLCMAAALAVYGSHKISVLRQKAFEASRLGQYQLKRRIGAGGMGEVYLAEHVLLRRPCAVKLIRPERAGDPNNLARFEREVRTTATLTHPNTVQVFDYGHTDNGTFYYAMEYLPGLNLDQMVTLCGPLPPERAVYLLRQVCSALQEAHGVALIHRDIKPSNIIVCQRGGLHDVAKLLDFGLVVQTFPLHQENQKMKQESALAGTPAYMSPEQVSGKEDIDWRSDIYSLGCVAYFLLTGQAPFAGRSSMQVLAAHLYEAPAPLTIHVPNIPSALQAIVLRCLAKDPAERFHDAHDLEKAIGSCPSAGQWTEEAAANWWHSESALRGSMS